MCLLGLPDWEARIERWLDGKQYIAEPTLMCIERRLNSNLAGQNKLASGAEAFC